MVADCLTRWESTGLLYNKTHGEIIPLCSAARLQFHYYPIMSYHVFSSNSRDNFRNLARRFVRKI